MAPGWVICKAMQQSYSFSPEPPIILDSKRVTPADVHAGCIITNAKPEIGVFDEGKGA